LSWGAINCSSPSVVLTFFFGGFFLEIDSSLGAFLVSLDCAFIPPSCLLKNRVKLVKFRGPEFSDADSTMDVDELELKEKLTSVAAICSCCCCHCRHRCHRQVVLGKSATGSMDYVSHQYCVDLCSFERERMANAKKTAGTFTINRKPTDNRLHRPIEKRQNAADDDTVINPIAR